MYLLITTQYMENYGAHEWDGVGDCPQYWKPKGGCEYKVKIDENDNLDELYMKALETIEYSDEGSKEYGLGYVIISDDYLTLGEQMQLKYEGKILYPAKVLEINR